MQYMQKGRILFKFPRVPHTNKLFEFSAVQKLRNTKTNHNYYTDQKEIDYQDSTEKNPSVSSLL